MRTSVKVIEGVLHLVTDEQGCKLHTRHWNWTPERDSSKELAEHQHRFEQLIPQPKVEFERDPEDMDDWDEWW